MLDAIGGDAKCPHLDNSGEVLACLDGHTLAMQGDEIPADPNGYDQNVNFGQATQ